MERNGQGSIVFSFHRIPLDIFSTEMRVEAAREAGDVAGREHSRENKEKRDKATVDAIKGTTDHTGKITESREEEGVRNSITC